MGWGCNTRIHSIYFSLKCFLQKALLNLFRKAKQYDKARRIKLELDVTSEQA